MQMLIGAALHALEGRAGVVVLPEQRVRITETRVRIPDLCVVRASDPDDQVVVRAPVLCIEILSPDDRMSEMQERVEDYLQIGTEQVWIVDPWRLKAYAADRSGVRESPGGKLILADPLLSVDCSLLWP
jgi:Uma2 family endonuclease